MSELAGYAGIPGGGICAETDPEVFYPAQGGSARVAKRICVEVCDVTDECLRDALQRGERFGVWGGKSERERRKIAKVALSKTA